MAAGEMSRRHGHQRNRANDAAEIEDTQLGLGIRDPNHNLSWVSGNHAVRDLGKPGCVAAEMAADRIPVDPDPGLARHPVKAQEHPLAGKVMRDVHSPGVGIFFAFFQVVAV